MTTTRGLAPRFPVAGVWVSRTTYADATARIIAAAHERTPLTVAPTSVHGLTMGALEPSFGRVLNSLDLVTPDGQPVRWALNLLHGTDLRDRVYGPKLMWDVCEAAARSNLGVYLYGSRPEVLARLSTRLASAIPELHIAGFRSPPFRPTTAAEDAAEVRDILDSGARIVFIGLGCPRQEQWAAAHCERLPMPQVCVGAAFDFHAGSLPQAPVWMQDRGLEWFYRFCREPRRLWRRYAKHIPIFVALVGRQYLDQRLDRIPRTAARRPRPRVADHTIGVKTHDQ
jgi:N-acetylglucosaminyldiphosphoundecaprenol N-acetyl-beta-D-mannosaminyltransferase